VNSSAPPGRKAWTPRTPLTACVMLRCATRPASDSASFDGRLCPPGTMLCHPDPHFEGAFHTATGGEILIVQYPGPSTGERPIYAGRFNMEKRKAVAEERVDL
jgi:hypothetical protein